LLKIKAAISSDLPVLAKVYDTAWRHTLAPFADPEFLSSRSPAHHEKRFLKDLSEGAGLYLALWEDVPCGMLMLYPQENQLAKVYLLPVYQGKGIGRTLVEFALGTLPGKEVFLWAMNYNEKARKFYEHIGFRSSGEEVVIDPASGLTQIKYIYRKEVFSMTLEEKLRLLCEATGVTGDEGAASEVAADLLREYTDKVTITPDNSVHAIVYEAGEDKPTLLFDAHIDEIGMIVTHIDDDGFVRVGSVGGMDRRLLLAQEVVLHGTEEIPGVVLTRAPHLQSPEEHDKVPEVKDIIIDTGIPGDELKEILCLGDRATLKSRFVRLQGDHVSSKAMDDRSCAVCIFAALDELKGKELPVNLAVSFTSQEEITGTGATNTAYTLHPDVAIAVDVTNAMTPDSDKLKCSELGKGAAIGIAPALDRKIWKKLIALAKEHDIPYQHEVMGGHTATNADLIVTVRGGVRTGLISLPLRYMHTPIEVARLCDIEAIGKLLAAYALDPEL